VLSAGPSPTEVARAEHRLFGFRDPAEPCSAAEWAALAANEVTAAHQAGRMPILVGGTGLYLRTLLDGIAPIPPIDPAVRSSVRSTDVASNHARLMQADPESAARLRPTDTTRIARALEVVLSTGHPLSHWQKQRSGGIGGGVTLQPLLLLPPRPWLYERCDQRFAGMIDDGAAEEVQELLARNLDPSLPAMRAIGVREIAAWLEGDSTREQAVAAGAQATRNYAKRQYTWFVHQPPAQWPRFLEPLDGRPQSERALALVGASV
jgi:tRNA dimethylallyltransferase